MVTNKFRINPIFPPALLAVCHEGIAHWLIEQHSLVLGLSQFVVLIPVKYTRYRGKT